MYTKKWFSALIGAMLVMFGAFAQAGDLLKPYTLAYTSTSSMEATVAEVKGKLTAAGFEVVGSYQPHSAATVLAVTSDELRKAAASGDHGGYFAAMRVTVTQPFEKGADDKVAAKDGPLQVAYTNPAYWAAAYRLADDGTAIQAKLESALGKNVAYGSFHKYANGISSEDLRKYHYMVGMEYFDDPSELAEYDSQDEAVKAVEAGLASGVGGVSKVYRVDIPGKQETVFGVAMTDGCSGDETIMSRIDHGDNGNHASGYVPYEILVTDGKVEALYARFRIAISFLGLPMIQSATGATFFSIMCAPNAIEEALIQAAGGE